MIRKTANILLIIIFITVLASCSNQTKLPPVQETVQPAGEDSPAPSQNEENAGQDVPSASGTAQEGGSTGQEQEAGQASASDLLSLAQAFRSAFDGNEVTVSHDENLTRYLDSEGSPVYTYIAQNDGSARLIFHKDGTVIRKDSVYILTGDRLVAEDGTEYGEDSQVFSDYDSLALEVKTQEHVQRLSASASVHAGPGTETELSFSQESVYTRDGARVTLTLTFTPSAGDTGSAGITFDTDSQGVFRNVSVSAGSLKFTEDEVVRLASLLAIR